MFEKILETAERLIRKARVPRCETPFVVLFQERSGSSHLCSILGNHPQVVCRQENFNEVNVDPDDSYDIQFGSRFYRQELNPFEGEAILSPSRRRIIAHFHDIFSCPVKASGFKFKFPVQPVLFPEIVKELKQFGSDLRVIALRRTNVLKQSISRQNMLRIRSMDSDNGFKTSNLWEHRPNEKVSFPFHLNIKATTQYAEQLIREQKGFDGFVDQFREVASVLNLTYEELLADQTDVSRKAFEFLEVAPDATIYSSVAKATPDDLAETISNLNDLRQAVGGTALEPFLN